MSEILEKYISDKKIKIINSNTKKMVDEYEKNPNSEVIFRLFKDKPYMRIFFQIIKETLEKKMLDKEQLYNELSCNLKEILPNPIFKDILCKDCNHLVKSYNPYIQKKSRGVIKCPNCKRDIELKKCREENDWKIPIMEFNNILEQFYQIHFLDKHFTGFCESCSVEHTIETPFLQDLEKINQSQLKNIVKNLYCQNCKQIISTKILYSINKEFKTEFWTSGTWFEWYIKKIIENKKMYVKQGTILQSNGNSVNIDVLFVKNKKIYGIECKAINPKKIVDQSDVVDATNYIEFFNKSYLALTGNIKHNDEEHLKHKHVITIEGRKIENIDKYI